MLWVLLVLVLGAMLGRRTWAYVAAALGTLGIAAAIRCFLSRGRGIGPFMSPWLFALAALLAFCFNSRPNNSAKRHNRYQSRFNEGASTSTTTVTPAARAKQLGTLGSTGAVSATDEIRTCVNAFMLNIRQPPTVPRERSLYLTPGFSRTVYCKEAVRAGLVGGASTGNKPPERSPRCKRKSYKQLLASGKIKLLPP